MISSHQGGPGCSPVGREKICAVPFQHSVMRLPRMQHVWHANRVLCELHYCTEFSAGLSAVKLINSGCCGIITPPLSP